MKKELQLKRPRNRLLNRYADIISEGRFSRELGHVRHGSQLPSHWAGQLVALRRRQVPRSRACTEDGRRVYVSIIYSEWDARRAAQSRAAYRSPTVWLFWPPQQLREPRNRFSDQHRYKRRGDESPGRVDASPRFQLATSQWKKLLNSVETNVRFCALLRGNANVSIWNCQSLRALMRTVRFTSDDHGKLDPTPCSVASLDGGTFDTTQYIRCRQ